MTKNRHADYTCAMEAALSVISGKWKLKIVNQLLRGSKRYSEIYKSIPGMTEKMLSQQLRELEEDKIISRKIYPEVPPKVEYSLTDLGSELSTIFKSLEIWGKNFFIEKNPDGEIVVDATCYTLVK
jgi:DNA-binding HxlR family transcriptional regulator